MPCAQTLLRSVSIRRSPLADWNGEALRLSTSSAPAVLARAGAAGSQVSSQVSSAQRTPATVKTVASACGWK